MFVKGAVLPWERGCGKIERGKGGMTDAYRTGADEKSGERGADLILFPEVQLTEFFPQYEGRDVQRVEHLGIAQRLSGGERKGV